MELKTIELIEKLSLDIKNTDIYKEFKKSESLLLKSDEVALLSYKKDMAIMHYEDTLKHYDKNSPEVMKCSKEMSEAIYDLNNNDIVKVYNKNLADLNYFLKQINNKLFGDLYD